MHSSSSRTVEHHVLGTIEALACRFNSTGSDFVESLDVHALESQASVISSIFDSLKTAFPEPGPAQIEYRPAEWNTWLTTSACARPSALSGRKAGRRSPLACPGSNSVWWLDRTECVFSTIHNLAYLLLSELCLCCVLKL